MKKFKYLRSKSHRCFELPNGKLVDVYSCRYDAKVDLKKGTFMVFSYSDEYKNLPLPTFNELVAQGVVKEVTCIEHSYDITLPTYNCSTRLFKDAVLPKRVVNRIIKEFNENGFNITEKAIMHNYSAWLGDLKSGYRDKKNNYHLFSPCGCNTLSFRATTLHRKCADWQTTYEY